MQALAAAERDGHTLYLPSSSSLVVLPETNSKLPLDIERDLVPIGLVGEQPFMIVAGNTLGVSTLPELIALAKSKPDEIDLRRQFPRLAAEHDRRDGSASRAGIELTFVPYPGAPQGLQDVLGGRVSAMVEGLAAFVGPMQSNSVKPLAITSPKRLPNYPEPADRRRDRAGLRLARLVRVPGARRHAGRRGAARSTPTCAPCSTSPRCGSGSRRWRPTCAICRRRRPASSSATEQAAWRPVVQAGRRDVAVAPRSAMPKRKGAPCKAPLDVGDLERAYFRREIGM